MNIKINLDQSANCANPPVKIGSVEVTSGPIGISTTYTLWSNKIAEPPTSYPDEGVALRASIESVIIKALNSIQIEVKEP